MTFNKYRAERRLKQPNGVFGWFGLVGNL